MSFTVGVSCNVAVGTNVAVSCARVTDPTGEGGVASLPQAARMASPRARRGRRIGRFCHSCALFSKPYVNLVAQHRYQARLVAGNSTCRPFSPIITAHMVWSVDGLTPPCLAEQSIILWRPR